MALGFFPRDDWIDSCEVNELLQWWATLQPHVKGTWEYATRLHYATLNKDI